jgi:hypothetical protein
MANWIFPLTNGGKEDGFNDPGVNTFVGDYEKYVAREAIQNVLDAKREDAENVRIRFDLKKIDAGSVPGHDELVRIIASCRAYYEDDKKATDFFDHATDLLNKKQMPVLSIRDYNTTGLSGTDEDRGSNWYSMVRSVGSSHKANDAGGSFGIGKNAPFAASALRTVCYSTKLEDGSAAFIGVARLVTHNSEEGDPTQGTGYFGVAGEKGHPKSIRREADIPSFFRRKEQGTDIHILGYMGSDNWKQQLERATLEHFWPAISWGDLVVEIGDEILIDSNSLASHMEAARADALASPSSFYAGFNEAAYVFYDAFVNPQHTVEKELRLLKDVYATFKVGDVGLPNQVAMIRKTGMVIYKHGSFRGLRLKFAGVFVCSSDEGNTLLRKMEPPRHDEWDVDRPEKGMSRAVKKEYHDWLRETLAALQPKVESKVLEIDELADYLPDTISPDGGAGKNSPSDQVSQGNTDEPNEISDPIITETASSTAKRPDRDPGEKPQPPAEDPDPKEPSDPNDTDTEDENESAKKKRPAVLFAKGFADAAANEYVVFLRSDKATAVTVAISAVGEDAFTEEINLLRARDRDTNQELTVSGGKIEEVQLQSGQPRRLAVAFNDSARRAVNIATYEV